MNRAFRNLILSAVVPALLLAAACGDNAGPNPSPEPGAASQPLSGTVTVFAAASLSDAFNELAAEFERMNTGVEMRFNFAGSPTLRTQLEQGARADIYASADLAQMSLAKQRGVVVSNEKTFARNSLVVITPKSNPAGIDILADLKKTGIKLVLANADVPVGNYSRRVLTNLEKDPAYGAGFAEAVLRNLVSNESNVKQVVAKVELGEADAGIVYGTDVTPSVASALNRLEIPAAVNVIAEYPIALTKDASNARAAQAFVDFVLSAAGQVVLKKWGFLTGS